MTNLSLYEMTGEIADLQLACQNLDELSPEDAESVAQNAITAYIGQEMVATKIDNYVRFIKELESTDSLKAEEERLRARRKSRENLARRLKAGLLQFMEVSGQDEVKGTFTTATIAKSPVALQIVDEALIPPDYWITPDPVLSNAKVKEDLSKGVDVPGAVLVRGHHVRFK